MIEGTGNIGVEFGPNGVVVADNSRSPRLFKIVSGSNPYTANEVALIEADGSKLLTGNYEVTAAQKVLWEVNGNTSVPADTIVEATPNPFGGGFYFSYAATAVSLTSVTGTFTSGLTLTGASAVTQTLGSVSLASAGTYLVSYHLTGEINSSAVGDVIVSWLNVSSLGDILGSSAVVVQTQVASVSAVGSASATRVVTVAGAQTASLQAFRAFTGTISVSKILDPTDMATLGLPTIGGPGMTAVKIA